MAHLTSWSDLADAKVGVWGLGVEGGANVRKLATLGVFPVLVDDAPSESSFEGLSTLATDDGGMVALLGCDVVVKSPGISRRRAEVATLLDHGIPVRGGLGLWLEEMDPGRVVCITGTKGKSTTTAICAHMLRGLGHRAEAVGNIGRPPWDPTTEILDPNYWIVETSSYQATDVTTAPAVVAVTSLSPDHLDWHGGLEDYIDNKLSLCTKPGVLRVVAQGDDSQLREHAALLGLTVQWVSAREWSKSDDLRSALGLTGDHNTANAVVARAVLLALGVETAADDARLLAAAHGFSGLPSRCTSLGRVGEIEFVDDSLSTNVLPAQAALAAYADRPVALLVGGSDRGLDYGPLGTSVAERQSPTLVVTLPDNGPRIGAAIASATAGSVEVVNADDLDQAVAWAFAWAVPGAVILLSPAAPSFGRYRDYRERAAAFAVAAERCGALR